MVLEIVDGQVPHPTAPTIIPANIAEETAPIYLSGTLRGEKSTITLWRKDQQTDSRTVAAFGEE